MDFIQDVNIKCSKEELVECCESMINGDYVLKEQSTKQGKHLLILEYTNEDNNQTVKFIMQHDKTTDEIEIVPFRLSSTNYVVNHDARLHTILDTLALSKCGSFIGSTGFRQVMIINGKSKSCELGIVESGGKPQVKELESDVSSIGFTIKKTIKEYLNEEPVLKAKLSGIKTQIGLLNIVARYVLNKRMTGEMEFDDFLDLFRQACLLGADDPTVLKFYKIVKV